MATSLTKIGLSKETLLAAAEKSLADAKKLYDNPKTQHQALKPFARGIIFRRAAEKIIKND